MASKSSSLPKRIERVQNAVQQLPSVAAKINAASDQLGKSIAELDALLKKFSLGVPTWVTFACRDVPAGYYDNDEIGYAKIDGKWGIAIRNVWGEERDEQSGRVETWHFSDAPRLLRVNAVEMIPELLEGLIKNATEHTKTILETAEEVGALTDGINAVLESTQTSPPKSGK